VYCSRPTAAPWPATVLDIARTCEANNPGLKISGFLLFSNDSYLQFLEGTAKALDQLWAKIAADRRHKIVWLRQGEAAELRLAGLAMGYFDCDRERSPAQTGQLWRTRREWQESDAEALIDLLVTIASEKYPAAISAGRKDGAKGRPEGRPEIRPQNDPQNGRGRRKGKP